MRLRNKKTGEIVEDAYVRETHDFQFDGQKHILAVFKGNGHRPPERISGPYNSLAELNEEWEDAPEEPKGCWIINIFGVVEYTHFRNEAEVELLKEIGNYFETEEEAEKVAEKRKAWTRLEAGGFSLWSFEKIRNGIDLDYYTITVLAPRDKEALDLLFGGEDE